MRRSAYLVLTSGFVAVMVPSRKTVIPRATTPTSLAYVIPSSALAYVLIAVTALEEPGRERHPVLHAGVLGRHQRPERTVLGGEHCFYPASKIVTSPDGALARMEHPRNVLQHPPYLLPSFGEREGCRGRRVLPNRRQAVPDPAHLHLPRQCWHHA